MRKLILLMTGILASFYAFSQDAKVPIMPVDQETKLVTYKEVVELPGIDKMELYRRAFIWAKNYYPNYTNVLIEKDSVNGKLVGKAQFNTFRTDPKYNVKSISALIKYTISISFKDGKYRYEITGINKHNPSYLPIEKLFDEKDINKDDNFNTLTGADETFKVMTASLKEAMNKPSIKVKKDDW